MFELVYLHPFTNKPTIELDESKVHYSTGGVLIEMTKQSGLFVPWHRVNSIGSSLEALDQLMRFMAFPSN